MDPTREEQVVCRASPSLALIKYWGKADVAENIPATSSIAVTLDGLETVTSVRLADDSDRVHVGGAPAPAARYQGFFDRVRSFAQRRVFFHAESTNSFPTSAGLASSSSGFAALAMGCSRAAGVEASKPQLSALARVGSASAARAVYGGFVTLPAGAAHATPLHPPEHWPDLRIVVVAVQGAPKSLSSRSAMELTRRSSPYYDSWLRDSETLYEQALQAVAERDMPALGRLMRLSYLRMFSTMLAADPPVLYWLPDSVRVIALCERLRAEGMGVWETMDAGPQVKVACLASEVEELLRALRSADAPWALTVSRPGPGARIEPER